MMHLNFKWKRKTICLLRDEMEWKEFEGDGCEFFGGKCVYLFSIYVQTYAHTSLSGEKVKYPAGFTPPELIPGLHQTLVLGVLLEILNAVTLSMIELVDVIRTAIARDDDVGPVPAALKADVADLQRRERRALNFRLCE